MKLITFQPIEAVKDLFNKGYLECNKEFIDLKKASKVYDWVVEKMNETIKNENKVEYPIWAWAKCYNGICPPKHKGTPISSFQVKITFNKDDKDVFITDFRRYSFILHNTYIPISLKDKETFDKKIEELGISNEELEAFMIPDKYECFRTDKEYIKICEEIRKSFNRCITRDSDVLQACVWKINLSEVESIELLNDTNHIYGSLNYKRSNGTRINWRKDFYKKLK